MTHFNKTLKSNIVYNGNNNAFFPSTPSMSKLISSKSLICSSDLINNDLINIIEALTLLLTTVHFSDELAYDILTLLCLSCRKIQ